MIGVVNKIIELLASALSAVIGLLPDSPFGGLSFPSTGFWGWVGLVVPVEGILLMLAAWVGAILGWYAIRWVFRFVKYID